MSFLILTHIESVLFSFSYNNASDRTLNTFATSSNMCKTFYNKSESLAATLTSVTMYCLG